MHYNTKIKPMLQVIDRLRELLNNTNIKLPTIVVVGDQSASKSSVLESLSGVALPRGKGIVTRCPLILRLIHQENLPAPYAVISTTLDQSQSSSENTRRIDNLSDVGRNVQQLTNVLAEGKEKGISSKPIYLSVYGPQYPDLTMVDLPGITRVPIGEQPKNIEYQIKSMIQEYIAPPENIILSVIPLGVDFSTSEGLLMASRVDPNGKRTIIVATRPDEVTERGLDVKMRISIQQLALRIGIVVVKNRTQDELDQGIDWATSRQQELAYFRKHPELAPYLSHDPSSRPMDYTSLTSYSPDADRKIYVGSNTLASILVTLQSQAIRESFPDIKAKVQSLLQSESEKLARLPNGCTTVSECRMRLKQLWDNCTHDLQQIQNGNYSNDDGNDQLHLYARISDACKQCTKAIHLRVGNPFEEAYIDIIRKVMKENGGRELTAQASDNVFRSLVEREIKAVLEPYQNAVQNVRDLLYSILDHILTRQVRDFPNLKANLRTLFEHFLERQIGVVQQRMQELFESEQRPYTLDTYYFDTVRKLTERIDVELRELDRRVREASMPPLNGGIAIPPLPPGVGVDEEKKGGGGGGVSIFGTLKSALRIGMRGGAGGVAPAPQGNALINVVPYELVVNDMRIKMTTHALTVLAQLIEDDKMELESYDHVMQTQVNLCVYMNIVLKRLMDNFSKQIDVQLLFKFSRYTDGLQGDFQSFLAEMKDEEISQLMQEDASTAVKRRELQESVQKLRTALATIHQM